MTPDPLAEPGLDLAARNRRLLAVRQHWPEGALEECERLDQAYPGWSVSWLDENSCPGFERPACYWAMRAPGSGRQTEIFCADPALLAEAIENAPPPADWHIRQVIPPRTQTTPTPASPRGRGTDGSQ